MTLPSDPVRRGIDTVAGRTGLSHDAVAILFIVAGVLIIVFPDLVASILGIVLIVVGVLWLVQSRRGRDGPA